MSRQEVDDAAEKPPGSRTHCLDRRTVLCGVGLLGAGAALTACGGGGGSASAQTAASPSPAAGGRSLGSAADVPVGGGKIFSEAAVVVVQPTEGEFKAFSAVCTHQGCTVSEVTAEGITCACHNSLFSTTDGAVLAGPAYGPLEPAAVSESDGELVLDG